MGLASLDVWARLLIASRGIGPRYWLRLACALGTSVLATVITLPERLVLGPWLAWRFRGEAPVVSSRRDALVIVGFFRSGTTHLHNLLATHPDVVTPRWVQAMSPQGFWVSWGLLQLALVPFLPNQRPQDDVAFGPDWPAEDDFAHCNWGLASSLVGRLVLPGDRGEWSRFDGLEGASARERSRWRRVAAGFAWKVGAGRPGRSLLLKSPSHTGKVGELDRLFGGRVRFVHLSRDAEAVVRSNIAMHERLHGQALGDVPDSGEIRRALVGEYVAAEEACAAQLGALEDGASRHVRLRYEHLVADPLGVMERVCGLAGLRWDDEVRARAERYLAEVGDYSAKHRATQEPEEPELAALDRALREKAGDVEFEARPMASSGGRGVPVAAFGASGLASVLGAGAWLGLASVTSTRWDILAWPLGGVVGVVALRVAGRGGAWLGLWAALWALVLVGLVVWPLPEVAHGWTGPDRINNLRTAYGTFNNNYLYAIFGMLTAYRYASRRFARPPGM